MTSRSIATRPGARPLAFTVAPPAPRSRRAQIAATLAARERPARIEVGTCEACGGPVMLSTASGGAGCPCGAVLIPPAFMRPGGAS